MRRVLIAAALCAAVSAPGCTYVYKEWPNFLEHPPRSIVVLPPKNHSNYPDATYRYYSTLHYPIAARGYYPMPLHLVDRVLREEGYETPEAMHGADIKVVGELFDADAVMYPEILEWKPALGSSERFVRVSMALFDVDTRKLLWKGSGDSGKGLHKDDVALSAAGLRAAHLRYVDGQWGRVDSIKSGGTYFGIPLREGLTLLLEHPDSIEEADGRAIMDTAVYANVKALLDSHHGLVYGPYHPKHEEDLRLRRESMQAEAASR